MPDKYAVKRRKATKEEMEANSPTEGIDAVAQSKSMGLSDEVRRKQMLDDQCIIMDSIEKFIQIAKQKGAYDNFTIVDGSPGMLMHDLVGKKQISPLFNMSPAQLSLLVPKIKLYKVYYDEAGKKVSEKELIFPDHTSVSEIEKITSNKKGRGEGVGIKNFTYEFAGKNPAEGGIANCVLTLFFQDINTMLSEPEDSNQARFLDLLVPKVKELGEEYFRIKVVAGWADPIDPKEILIDKKLRKKIKESSTVLFLNLVKHNIDYREDGAVVVTIEYRGALEGTMSSPRSNLFLETELERKIKKWKSDLKKTSNDDIFERSSDVQRKKDLNYNITVSTARDKQEKYASLIREIRNDGNIFYFDIDHTFIENEKELREKLKAKHDMTPDMTDQEVDVYFKNLEQIRRKKLMKSLTIHRVVGKKRDLDILLKNLKQIGEDEASKSWLNHLNMSTDKHRENIDKTITQTFKDTTPVRVVGGKKRVNFIYAGDIINVVLRRFYQNNYIGTNNVEAIVGSLPYQKTTIRDKNIEVVTENINIADIPISLQLFITWYTKEVVKKQREKYYIGEFIKDFITKLIIPAIGKACSSDFTKQRPEVSIGNVTVGGRGSKGDKPPILKPDNGRTTVMDIRNTTMGENVLSDGTTKQINNLYHYFIIHATTDKLTENLSGNFEDDLQKGIYHLVLGADRGLLKGIKFSKTDIPYEAEHRATSDTNDTEKLFDRYNATITMIGNNLFRPGIYVYIDTSLAGLTVNPNNKSVARKLGIGGYYQVIKVEHVNGQDDYETVLECLYISSGTGKVKPETNIIKQSARDRNKIGHISRKAENILLSEKKKGFFKKTFGF